MNLLVYNVQTTIKSVLVAGLKVLEKAGIFVLNPLANTSILNTKLGY